MMNVFCSFTVTIVSGLLPFPLSSSSQRPIHFASDESAILSESKWGNVVQIQDTNKIVVRIDDKQVILGMANTLPFSKWPKKLSKVQKEIRDKANAFMKKWLQTQKVLLDPVKVSSEKPTPVYADLWIRDGYKWKAATPAEKLGWGMFHLNMLLIQEGFSVYVQDGSVVPNFPWPHDPQKKRLDFFRAAEQYAQKNKKGIWQDREFALELKKIAKSISAKNK